MKTTLSILLLTFICLSSKAQDLKNEISVELTSLYVSPISKNADNETAGIYPLSGLRYTRHLSKLSVFASFNRYTTFSSILRGPNDIIFFGEVGDEITRSYKESNVRIGVSSNPDNNKFLSPIASISLIQGSALTKSYENDGYFGASSFRGNKALREIRYFGINSSLGIRYNINTVFHIDLSTEVGIVRTTGNYKVFIDHSENPTVFEYDERAIVPMCTLAKISVGVNF